MSILCIETATDAGIVALARDGTVVAEANWRSSSRHGENLFGHIDAVLKDAGVERTEIAAVGVDIGPGKFTSLRVGLATAKGLALGLSVPIVGVSSLRVLARTIDVSGSVARVALLNGYRGDLFAASYLLDDGIDQELVAPLFGPPERILPRIVEAAEGREIAICGEGVEEHLVAVRAALGAGVAPQVELEGPSAKAIALEVDSQMRRHGPDDLASLEPRYLRPSDAKLPAEALRTTS